MHVMQTSGEGYSAAGDGTCESGDSEPHSSTSLHPPQHWDGLVLSRPQLRFQLQPRQPQGFTQAFHFGHFQRQAFGAVHSQQTNRGVGQVSTCERQGVPPCSC